MLTQKKRKITLLKRPWLLRVPAPKSLTKRKLWWPRIFRLLATVVVFPTLIIFVGSLLSSEWAIPPMAPMSSLKPSQEAAASVLTGLSSFLLTIALSLSALAAIVLRLPNGPKIDGLDWLLCLAGVFLAFVSMFLGYRFLIDMASQLALYQLDLDLILSELKSQAFSALASASMLLGLAIDRFCRKT